MRMDFKQAAKLGGLLSRDYAEGFFRLIVVYHSISASEAASRLGLHIKTAQDFLESLTELGVLIREEVHENKRPYFRYRLEDPVLGFELNLSRLFGAGNARAWLSRLVRERKNAPVIFNIVDGHRYISSIVVHTGQGRERRERRVNLTRMQGRFLYHLPFPTAAPMTVADIMEAAGIGGEFRGEIIDLVQFLQDHGVIEMV